MNRSYKIIDSLKLLDYTLEYLGKPVKSDFNKLYRTAPHIEYVDQAWLYLDPTGEKGLLDVSEYHESIYLVQPDVWISHINLAFRNSGERKKNFKNLIEELGTDELYFTVLRRIGDPSFNYMIENNYDNVFILTSKNAINYYNKLVNHHKYQELVPNNLSIDFINNNIFKYNILEK